MPKTLAQIQTDLADGLVSDPWVTRAIEDRRNAVRGAVADLYALAGQDIKAAVDAAMVAHEGAFHAPGVEIVEAVIEAAQPEAGAVDGSTDANADAGSSAAAGSGSGDEGRPKGKGKR